MNYAARLRAALQKQLPESQLHFMAGWQREWYRSSWAGKGGLPVALMLHHTAGAATDSTAATAPGNKHGANAGVIKFVNRHPDFDMPCSAFTLDRDGCVYVNAALPCYHAGKGTFTNTEWSKLGIPKDSANSYLLGVEIVSKGVKADYTAAQKQSLAALARACAAASGWPDTSTLRLPRHKDWAPTRKVDIKYSNATVQQWLKPAKPKGASA